MTTFIANAWDSFITALYKPFIRIQENKIKLEAAIQMDKQDATQRHTEELLRIQEKLAEHNTRIVQESTSVVKEWLQGLTQLSAVQIKAPPVMDDERQWLLEMERNGHLPETDEMEDFIRKELANL